MVPSTSRLLVNAAMGESVSLGSMQAIFASSVDYNQISLRL